VCCCTTCFPCSSTPTSIVIIWCNVCVKGQGSLDQDVDEVLVVPSKTCTMNAQQPFDIYTYISLQALMALQSWLSQCVCQPMISNQLHNHQFPQKCKPCSSTQEPLPAYPCPVSQPHFLEVKSVCGTYCFSIQIRSLDLSCKRWQPCALFKMQGTILYDDYFEPHRS
jgi:hypothetical protein